MGWAALVIVLGQAAVMATLFVFVKTFGTYTEALMATHKSNLLVHQLNTAIVADLKQLRESQILADEIAVSRAAQFTHDPRKEIA